MKKEKQTRRFFMKVAGLSLAGLPFAFSALAQKDKKSKEKFYAVYVGTYAKAGDLGLYQFRLNGTTGQLTKVSGYKGGANPSFLTLAPDHQYLYAVNEVTEFNGSNTGAVSAFAIDKKTGRLTLLNQQATGGGAPCYISLDKSNKFALVANYVGGNVAIFPLQPNGHLGNLRTKQQHQGKGPNVKRQEAPHAHCIVPAPDNKFVFAIDLGIDKVKSYRLDTKQGGLIPNPEGDFTTKAGAGPRHLTFHPNGKFAFLIHELDNTISVLAYNSTNGSFTQTQSVSTLPAGVTQESFCADIHVSPNGKFLYGSNRGHDSLVVYAINAETGNLTLVEHVRTQGKWPRNFGFDPSGNILLVANQNTNNIVTFKADSQTGKLTATGHSVEVPSPVCVQVIPAFPA
ncbi:lactonase family protein [Adhaeribacter rhizoryzae]|uniref:Lactonase family protein n=1 Tax=Adhaeribacter rhizoryzae TaxID=2607907 RepID=A0A5M6DGM5_9BACT|nr:lactonase family protein [Adhaeribacter rhizoryzae]KAA5546688.1 lactonase family protein [Adhaeribacter rhizoryzae]